MLKIYHNTRCSKSRQALELLQGKGQEVEVVEYLKKPPTAAELTSLIRKLNMKPEELLRKGEKLYKENYKGKSLSDEQWVQVMVDNPVLIERPIIVRGDKAVVGRPPDKVQELLD
jgi:arsenate reductase